MKLQSTFARHDLTSEGDATELGLPSIVTALVKPSLKTKATAFEISSGIFKIAQ